MDLMINLVNFKFYEVLYSIYAYTCTILQHEKMIHIQVINLNVYIIILVTGFKTYFQWQLAERIY